jgi:hypothetical protein
MEGLITVVRTNMMMMMMEILYAAVDNEASNCSKNEIKKQRYLNSMLFWREHTVSIKIEARSMLYSCSPIYLSKEKEKEKVSCGIDLFYTPKKNSPGLT